MSLYNHYQYCSNGSRNSLISTRIRGKWKIGYNRSESAMFTIKMLIGVLRVFFLKTIIPMKAFAASDTTNSTQ